MSKTLRDLREDSKLPLHQILAKMGEVWDEAPTEDHTRILKFEMRGTDRLPILRAFAHAYNLPLEVVEEAGRNSKNIYAAKKCAELEN